MSKLQAVCIFLLLFPSAASLADTEFGESIPTEIVEALFNSYSENQFAVYSDIAEEFPDFPVPAGFTVVGSVYQMTTLRVVFETDLDKDSATASFVGVFESQDWTQFPLFSRATEEVGFIAPNQFNVGASQIICHDDLGHMTLRYLARDTGSYLSAGISLYRNNQQGNCAQQLEMQRSSFSQMSRSNGIRQYLPRMEIPESQNRTRSNVFMMGGTSSSGNSVETDGSITSDQNIDEVYRFFADQIEEQGWKLDSEAAGSLSANGVWTKSPESGLNLIGRLSVLSAGDSNYELEFVLTAEGYTGGNSGIFNAIRR